MTRLNPYTNKPLDSSPKRKLKQFPLISNLLRAHLNKLMNKSGARLNLLPSTWSVLMRAFSLPTRLQRLMISKTEFRTTMTQRQTSRSGSRSLSKMLMMQRGWKEIKTSGQPYSSSCVMRTHSPLLMMEGHHNGSVMPKTKS